MGSSPSAWKILSRPCPLCASRAPRQTSGLPAGAEPSFESRVILASTNSKNPAAFEEHQEKGLHPEYQLHPNTPPHSSVHVRMNAGIRYPEGQTGRPTGHERGTVQRMPERRVPCREIAGGAGQVALDGGRRGAVAPTHEKRVPSQAPHPHAPAKKPSHSNLYLRTRTHPRARAAAAASRGRTSPCSGCTRPRCGWPSSRGRSPCCAGRR